ncbi:Hypothetical protein PSEBR_a2014 [Pseudomonas brassicacearum subsp. brassicacearum NFM421]|uniref:Uncharacterized protein n=1 Tax=Pseudomonas brassicacearum (strain NFM421) TaxID=994484 RepID=F2K9W5_PSEBN|nr:Hypothetical protein PSEBR_a2014 [Pseudomonas brassicacearum subsp. brassicacearum NFM421]
MTQGDNEKEVAKFTVTLKDSVTEQHIVPMETENLIIVREPQTSKICSPYQIQLDKNFVVIGYKAVSDSQNMLEGASSRVGMAVNCHPSTTFKSQVAPNGLLPAQFAY